MRPRRTTPSPAAPPLLDEEGKAFLPSFSRRGAGGAGGVVLSIGRNPIKLIALEGGVT